MNRRGFLHALGAGGSAAAFAPVAAHAAIPEHNWDKYGFGDGPPASDRLYQGPFPQCSVDAVVPGSEMIMVTTPSTEIVPNYGMSLVIYISGDTGPPHLPGETLEKSIEDLVKIPFTQKVYIRPTGERFRSVHVGWISPTGGRLRSIWPSSTTSGSGFASCWRIQISQSQECRSS